MHTRIHAYTHARARTHAIAPIILCRAIEGPLTAAAMHHALALEGPMRKAAVEGSYSGAASLTSMLDESK
jgi:hypothetical protein